MSFDNVGIVGLGLIGGSIALALKEKKVCRNVYGYARTHSVIEKALKMSAIDEGFLEKEKLAAACSIIIVATPPCTIPPLIKEMSKVAKPKTIFTDVASIKEEIVKELKSLERVEFVGAHPLAGSEKSGIDFARADLFEGKVCIIIPSEERSTQIIKKLWEEIGAKVLFLSASEHDKIFSFTSHLPHLLAYLLCSLTKEYSTHFIPQSLRDMTRIAKSNAALWKDIFLLNKENMKYCIKKMEEGLKSLEKAIKDADEEFLQEILEGARDVRMRWDERN